MDKPVSDAVKQELEKIRQEIISMKLQQTPEELSHIRLPQVNIPRLNGSRNALDSVLRLIDSHMNML